jgi:hypothetical protein
VRLSWIGPALLASATKRSLITVRVRRPAFSASSIIQSSET